MMEKLKAIEAWKLPYLQDLQASIDFFSRDRKEDRERWVVTQLLDSLGVSFQEADLIVPGEPADIAFENASFQVKELIDHGRRRELEYRNEHKRVLAADSEIELGVLYSPRVIHLSKIIQDCVSRAQELESKYGPMERNNLDLLMYHNELNVLEKEDKILESAEVSFRSLSVVSNCFRLVLQAKADAPEFLRGYVGKVMRVGIDAALL